MIGEILVHNRPAVQMQDDGTYSPTEPMFEGLAEFCNAQFNPMKDRAVGDSGRRFGVGALTRASLAIPDSRVRIVTTPDIPEESQS